MRFRALSCLLLWSWLAGIVCVFPLVAEEEKPRLAVLGWEARDATAAQAEAVAEEMRGGFTRSGRFTVVDRTLTAKILEEWERQQSGLNESERAIQVGKLYNVRFIVTGKLIRVEGNAWLVSAAMLDAQTGVTRDSQTLRHRGEYFDLLGQIAALSARLAGLETEVPQAAALTPAPTESGALWREPITGMEFLYIQGGEYEQGCHPQAGKCDDD
jgi:TolB-like protein